MEFNEKLHELRKAKGLTQEELSEMLHVSRTAISKWESGRGYPSIDSIKDISKFFNVTIDELLSSDEVLNIAEEDNKKNESHSRAIVFGLLDISIIMFFFLPLFGQKEGELIREVSLLFLSGIESYLTITYYVAVIMIAVYGVMTLALQKCSKIFWLRNRDKISLILNIITLLIFIISSQPYAATVLFVYLAIKIMMLIKW